MNYGQLKQAVLDTAHRADLASFSADFVRRAEGMIRRELRAYPLSYTLTDADRVSNGVYTLPSNVLEVRAIFASDVNGNSYALEQVGLSAIRVALEASASPVQYAIRGTQIEFRGVPATGSSLELLYLGSPTAFSADADTNALLTDHEAIYLQGALYHLYVHTQDLELAQAALEACTDAIDKVNQTMGRKLGGARGTGAYNFSPSGTY